MINIPNGGFPPIICSDKKINKDLKKLTKKGSINLIDLQKKPKNSIFNKPIEDKNILEEINEL
jgi:hypothetical protein